jgi:hypothetical protein
MTGIAVFAGLWVVIIALWILIWWEGRRTTRRMKEDNAAYVRQMEERNAAHRRRMELAEQLRQVEEQIREERLPDEEREWRRRYREEQSAIKREARRRLGLPEEDPMKTVYCDLCGQQLTEAEVEGTARLPAEPHQRWWQKDDELVMYPSIAIRRLNGRPLDACWRCVAEHLLAVAPPRPSGVPR